MNALRYMVLGLLLLALWGPSLPLAPVRTVVLLDQSPSAQEGTLAVASQLNLPGARYVAFASSAEWVASPTARRVDLGQGTNLNAAIQKALELQPDRLLLVSDGLWQTPTSVPPVPLFAVVVPSSQNLSLSLQGPAFATQGETVEVRAIVEATASTTATLRLVGPAGVVQQTLQIQAGRQSVGYRFALNQAARVQAQIQSPLGTRQATLEVRPSDQLRVLVLGDPSLARYAQAQGFAVQQDQPIAQPIGADVVVLGVGATALTTPQLEALQTFLQQGGSLLWTATPQGLFFGGWERSPLADALPLEPEESPGGVALVLVLDVSGSMLEAGKLDLALQGALELIGSARETDYVGVVAFSSGYRWVFEPRRMTPQGRRVAENLLLQVRAGGGTEIAGGYATAIEALRKLQSPQKQVLVLTDGLIQGSTQGPLQTAGAAAAQGIRTNTVALGSDADVGFLQALAKAGQGSAYTVPRAQDLPRFFLEEAQRSFRRNLAEGVFPITPQTHPLLRQLSPPAASVLLPAKSKPWAQTVLWSGERAVLAVGEAERGRVAALATDLSRSWRTWPQSAALVGNLLRWLAQTPAKPRLEAVRTLEGVEVRLQGSFERPRLRFAGQELEMVPTGPLRYELQLPAQAVGEAVVWDGAEARLRFTLPALSEWRIEDGAANLRQLSQASGGALVNTSDTSNWPQRKALDLRIYLLALALLLFLTERYWLWRKLRGDATLA